MSDWMPGTRDGQITMAETWLTEIPARGAGWGVPSVEVSILTGLANTARNKLEQVKNKGQRTAVDVAECNTAFENLKNRMRYDKDHWLIKPPLTDGDLVALGLPIPSQTHSPVPPPTGFAEADVSYPGVGVLELRCRPVEGQPPLDWRSDYGYRIYYGVLPPGGASVEQATGKQRLLMQPPESADLLPHSQWCRRKKEQFDFHGSSGWTAWFCIRYENSKGDFGYWGPLFSAVIP